MQKKDFYVAHLKGCFSNTGCLSISIETKREIYCHCCLLYESIIENHFLESENSAPAKIFIFQNLFAFFLIVKFYNFWVNLLLFTVKKKSKFITFFKKNS